MFPRFIKFVEQTLLTIDQIPFSVYPVANRHEFEIYYNEKFENEDSAIILCINHSADFDILSFVMNETVEFWIIDSHRPININNAFNAKQVKVVCKQKEAGEIPRYQEVFEVDSDDDKDIFDEEDEGLEEDCKDNNEDEQHSEAVNDDDTEDDEINERGKRKAKNIEERASKRSRMEIHLEKSIKKKEWRAKRDQILIDYDEFAFFGTSVALLLCELAIKLSKESNEILWLALVGLTSQYLENKIDRDSYMEGIAYLKGHIGRLNRECEEAEPNLSISFSNELILPLLRHWNVYDSMYNSSTVAAAFCLYNHDGKSKLNGFLADLGLPVAQCKKSFVAMDLNAKENFENEFRVQLNRYQLEESDLFLPSFLANFKMHGKFSALDFYYLINGSLYSDLKVNNEETDETLAHSYYAANNARNILDFLTLKSTNLIKEAVPQGVDLHTIIMETVRSFISKALVCGTSSFLYVSLPQDDKNIILFQLPVMESCLARYTLEIYVRGLPSRNKRFRQLPLILRVPCLCGGDFYCGIPPYDDTSCKNVIHSAFEQASKVIGFEPLNKLFDRNMVLIRSEDKSKFLDTLATLLA